MDGHLNARAIVLRSFLMLMAGCSAPPLTAKLGSASGLPDGLSVSSIRIDGLNADFFHGLSEGRQPALILLGGSEGGKSWSDHPAQIQQLVEQGYCVLSLAYFGDEGLPQHLRAIPLEYVRRAFRWLSSQEQVISKEYVLLG